jgi:hypothetical protein
MNAPAKTSDEFTLQRDEWGRLVLALADGRQVVGVDVVRAFPISAPGEHISICDADGHEVLSIDDPATLPPTILELVSEELSRREFVPTVLQIEKVFADTDPSQWRIVTDRGKTTFLMEDSDNDVRRLGPTRILLVDTHGIHYLIPDTRRLDAASRRILDRYL